MKLFKHILVALLILLSVTWCSLSPRFNSSLYSRQLFHPEWGIGSAEDVQALHALSGKQTSIATRDGTILNAWFFPALSGSQVILFHPGNAGDIAKRTPMIKLLMNTGASVLMYEPRGFGSSPGQPSPRSICEDGEAAYDYLVTLGFSADQIVLYGESLGGAVATHVSTVRTVSGIITQGTFTALEHIGKERIKALRIYPGFMFGTPRLSNVAILSRKHPPLLILHGEKDADVPIAHAEKLFASAIAPKQLVRFRDSGHVTIDGNDPALFVETVKNFLASLS